MKEISISDTQYAAAIRSFAHSADFAVKGLGKVLSISIKFDFHFNHS